MTVRPRTEPAENKPGPAARMPAAPLRLDRLIRARAIHSMTGETYRSVGLRGAEIAAVSEDPHGLDALTGQATVVVEAGDLTVLPIRCWHGGAGTLRSLTRPRCRRPASVRERRTRRAAGSEGWPMAAETECWRAARCIRSPPSRPGQAEPSWPPLWARARPRTQLWGRAPSGRR